MLSHFFRKNKADATEPNSLNLQTVHSNNLKNQGIKLLPHLILAILFVGLAFYVKQETTQIKFIFQVSAERQANILSALNDIQSQMAALNKAGHEQIQSLQTSLTHLQESVAKEQSLAHLAQSAEVQQLAKQLQQLGSVHHSAHPLKKTRRKSHDIPMTLPFRVKSLDMIADQPYVSVEYQDNTLPLRANDQLAGWKAININLTDGKVVWKHLKTGRKITVAASRMGNE